MTAINDDKDEQVAARVKAGEVEAFGLLVDRYEAKISRYGRKFFSNGEDIKDLVQEIMLKAYVNIQSFDETRRFSPWLYRIAHNEFVNGLKKKARTPFRLEWDTLWPQLAAAETADGSSEQRALREYLDRYLDQLDIKYREPLILRYFEELDYREIADILHLPISTIGVRLQRGRQFLKKLMTAENQKYD